MVPKLGYWNVGGRVTPIRLLLAYADVDYEFKEYDLLNPTEWFGEEKEKMQNVLDFPNLPYYIDGDMKLTHTDTIMFYLGKKYNLAPSTLEASVRVSLAIEQMKDLVNPIGKIVYVPDSVVNRTEVQETLRKDFAETLPKQMAQFSKFLGNQLWIAGNELTFADFGIYSMLDLQRSFFKQSGLDDFANLVSFMKRIEELPRVKEFIATKFIKIPNDLPQFERYAFFWKNS